MVFFDPNDAAQGLLVKLPKARLVPQGAGVVNAVGNFGCFQFLDEPFAILGQNRILGVGALASGFDFLRNNLFAGGCGAVVFGKKGVVLGRILAPYHEFFVEVLELDSENCRLQCVESAVHTGNFVLVTPGAPMVCDHADLLGVVFVGGKERAAVSVAAEGLLY